MPAFFMHGTLSRVEFPTWLGKNSSRNKKLRQLQEISAHMYSKTRANAESVLTDYLPHLLPLLTQPLLAQGKEGIPAVLNLMEEYGLTRDDWESIAELQKFDVKQIPTAVRSAFTREYNKAARATKVSLDAGPSFLDGEDEDEESLEPRRESQESLADTQQLPDDLPTASATLADSKMIKVRQKKEKKPKATEKKPKAAAKKPKTTKKRKAS
eukprot:TRINITY_DN68706_c0_g1_i2.p2 TRINITY_DN68706_c0_g1~~TRINITY_DN68706_c0_g1_i2.p2  ORF type:complete len:212 (-),score=20.30 TRINITY_DN68706_c0_g1_i2:830-1465(-)